MTTLDYIREMEADKDDDLRRKREEEWEAELAWELDDAEHQAEIILWAMKHGILSREGS